MVNRHVDGLGLVGLFVGIRGEGGPKCSGSSKRGMAAGLKRVTC